MWIAPKASTHCAISARAPARVPMSSPLATALPPFGGDLLDHLLRLGEVDVADHHRGALLGEVEAVPPPDPASAARHHGGPAIQQPHFLCLPDCFWAPRGIYDTQRIVNPERDPGPEKPSAR